MTTTEESDQALIERLQRGLRSTETLPPAMTYGEARRRYRVQRGRRLVALPLAAAALFVTASLASGVLAWPHTDPPRQESVFASDPTRADEGAEEAPRCVPKSAVERYVSGAGGFTEPLDAVRAEAGSDGLQYAVRADPDGGLIVVGMNDGRSVHQYHLIRFPSGWLVDAIATCA